MAAQPFRTRLVPVRFGVEAHMNKKNLGRKDKGGSKTPRRCGDCDGTGWKHWTIRGQAGDTELVSRKCQTCRGKGKLY
jgi:DnaJ-class molecular chaperone